MFENLTWLNDRMLCNGLVFRLEHYKSETWELGDRCFVFYKIKKLLDQYERFFATRDVPRKHIFELGLWEGGSLPFWFETLRPEKIVGIDIQERHDSPYLRQYVSNNGLADRLKACWGVDQSDSTRLQNILDREFGGSVDLVFDDASHVYGLTLSSFQTIFPRVRPGGFYIIEDWAWEHWPECYAPGQALAAHKGLTDLICDVVRAAGTSESIIRSVTVYEGFAAIERGPMHLTSDFRLEDHIVRRPAARHPTLADRAKARVRKLLPS